MSSKSFLKNRNNITLPNSVSLSLIGECTRIVGFLCSRLGTDFAPTGSAWLVVSSFVVFIGVRGLGVDGKSLGVVLTLAFSATRANKIQNSVQCDKNILHEVPLMVSGTGTGTRTKTWANGLLGFMQNLSHYT